MCIGVFGYVNGETVYELIFLTYYLDTTIQYPSILLVFDGSGDEDDNSAEDEEDERLPYLFFFSLRFY